MTQLPSSVLDLKHLRVLDLSGNALTSIPEDVVKLSSLKVLDVTGNPIEAVPKGVARSFYGATEIRWDGAASKTESRLASRARRSER